MHKCLLLIAILLGFCCISHAQSSLSIGEKVPEITITDWIANIPADKSLENKFLVIDFWATWCGPCIAAVPHFNELQASVSDREDVLFLSFTYESPEKVNKTLQKINFETTVVTDQDKTTQQRFGINAIPRTLVISPNGILLWEGHPKKLRETELKKLFSQNSAVEAETSSYDSDNTEAQSPNFLRLVGKAKLDTTYTKDFQIAKSEEATLEVSIEPTTYLYSGISVPGLISSIIKVPQHTITAPETIQNTYFKIFFLDKSLSSKQAAQDSLMQKVLAHNHLQLQEQQLMQQGYRLSLKDADKLEPSTEGVGAVSEADNQVIISNQPMKPLLNYLHKTFKMPFMSDDTLSGNYDFIINTSSLKAALESLNSYGIVAQPAELEVTTYTLVAVTP